MAFEESENICIFGLRGCGKSTLGRQIQAFFPNLFIFDSLSEYDESDGLIFYDYQSFSDFVIQTQNQNGIRAIIRFDIEEINQSEILDEFIKILYYRGNCTIMIEEIQNFASVHKISPFLKQASLTGRHKKVNFITTTQRVAEIHKSLLSQAHHIFAGYTDSPNDKKTLREYGFDMDEIDSLEKYSFLWKNGKNIQLIDNELNFINNKNINNDEAEEIEEVEEIEEDDESMIE